MAGTNSNSITERLLIDAGIVPGTRVLDIGCANGDVSLLLAELVGPSGEVVGIDRDEQPLLAARERVQGLGLANVTFIQSDLAGSLPALAPFDAAVGRRVLMYLPNPIDVVRRISVALRPGGVVVFQEHDSTMVPGRCVALPLHDQVLSWIWQTVEREGANIHIGFDLQNILEQAGLAVEHIRAEAILQGQGTHHPLHFIVRAMLPRMFKHGVVSGAEVDIDTLEERLAAERSSTQSIYVSDMAFGVWARKP